MAERRLQVLDGREDDVGKSVSPWCIFGTSLEGALGVLGLLKLDPFGELWLGEEGQGGARERPRIKITGLSALRSVVQRGRQRLFGKLKGQMSMSIWYEPILRCDRTVGIEASECGRCR